MGQAFKFPWKTDQPRIQVQRCREVGYRPREESKSQIRTAMNRLLGRKRDGV